VSVSFDFGEMNTLAADLGDAGVKVIPFTRKAVEVTARYIKDDWRDEAKKINSVLNRYPSSVDYDMELDTDGLIAAEIGPNLGKAMGSFGFVEEASGDIRSAPQRNVDRALRNNLADFEKGILQAGEDALK
jgi:hypothetical protein